MVTRIGDYFEIEDMDSSMLGVGGMGTVYKGVDTRTGETIAIKELKSEVLLSSPDILERFEREADALRMLNHPNIVKVLSSFNEGDHHYIVMDFVSGGSLRDLMDENRQLSIERVLEISLDLADALTRAHRLKVIHRDIKPANVMLAQDGTPRLTDFGVARIDEKTRMTETGMVVGTLSYLSPEALDGQQPDDRQDIWAFGVMLYEMVSGSRPFDGDTASSVITAILTKDVPDLSDLRPDTPPELQRLIEAMLEKDPRKRISSIRRVGTEIENIIRGVDSDEYDLDSDLVQTIKEADKSRFEADSDEITPPAPSPYTTAQPATKYGIPMHTGVKVVQDESGEEILMLPANVALKGRKFLGVIFLGLIVTIIALVAIINEGGDADESASVPIATEATTQSNELGIATANDIVARVSDIRIPDNDEFLALVIPSAGQNNEGVAIVNEFEPIVLDLAETFSRDIPFAKIHTEIVPLMGGGLPLALTAFEASSADVLIWLEAKDENTIRVVIQGGNPKMLGDTLFENAIEDYSRTLFAEVDITDPDNETIAPYVLGILSLGHTLDGNIFEFMRNFAVLEEIDKTPATLVSGGITEHYFNFFNQFLSDTPAAIDAMSAAIALDGGNPLWYAMRGVAYMRLNDEAQSSRDAKTAERIGPEGWSIPLIIQATVSDGYGSQTPLLDKALEAKDDWFVYYLRATFNYATNHLDEAWDDVLSSIDNDPQANYPYVTGFLIAIRQGRVQDAGDMMSQMVENEPDPTLGNRVYRATFGDNNIDVLMSGKLYEGFGNIVIGQYEPVTAFAPEFLAMMTNFDDLIQVMVEEHSDSNTQVFFPGDVMMMMGLSFCALEDYETSMEWLSQGVAVDPTSPLLRFIRISAANELGKPDTIQEDVAVIRGLSDEFDDLIAAGENKEIQCNDFFDYFVDLGDA